MGLGKNKTITKRFAILTIVVLTLISTVPVRPAQAVWIEYLGRKTREGWVPVFVLYDPPGENSWAKIVTETITTVDIKFDSQYGGSGIDAGIKIDMSERHSLQTSERSENNHQIILTRGTIYYDVYYYITPTSAFKKIVPVKFVQAPKYSLSGGYSSISFEDAPSYGIFITDLTGTEGPHELEFLYSKGTKKEDTYNHDVTSWAELEAGIEINEGGTKFKVSVAVKIGQSSSVSVTFHYEDYSNSFDIHMYSNYEISGNTAYGTPIWFNYTILN